MAKNKYGKPVFRLGALPAGQPAVQIREQAQIRGTAPHSPIYGQVKPVLDAWNGSTDAYQALLSELDSTARKLGELRAKVSQAAGQFHLDARCYRMAVAQVSKGNPELIQGLGYAAVAGKKPPAAVLAAPTDLVARPGVDPGAVHLAWKAVRASGAFAVQQSADPAAPTSWVSVPGTSHRQLRLGDLRPGQVLWFRVARVSTGKQSDWSLPASVTVR